MSACELATSPFGSGLTHRRREHQPILTTDYQNWDSAREHQPLLFTDYQRDAEATDTTGMEQAVVLDELKQQSQETFDSGNPEHEQRLVNLWSQCFPFDLYSRPSNRWRDLGFQSDDPARDLRGAGLLGLSHLTVFCATCGIDSFLMSNESFPLSLASFSVTAMLCRYLRLNERLVFPGCTEHAATAEVQADFVRLHRLHSQGGGGDLMQRLHAQLLLRLADAWASTRQHNPTATLMDFGACLRATYTHIHLAFQVTTRPMTLPALISNMQADSEALKQAQQWSVCHPLALYAILWMLAARLATGRK